MTRRDHGRAIGALHVSKGMERLPNAIDWTETDREWVIQLAGERTLVLSKAEYAKVGFIDYREPAVFGLTGGWHLVADDPYARFVESLDDDTSAARGKGMNNRAQRRGVTRHDSKQRLNHYGLSD